MTVSQRSFCHVPSSLTDQQKCSNKSITAQITDYGGNFFNFIIIIPAVEVDSALLLFEIKETMSYKVSKSKQ